MNKIVVCFFCVAENRWFAIPWNTLHLFGGGKKKMTALKRKTGKKGDWFGSPTLLGFKNVCPSEPMKLGFLQSRVGYPFLKKIVEV